MNFWEIIILASMIMVIVVMTFFKCWYHYVNYRKAQKFMQNSAKDIAEKVEAYKKRHPETTDEMEAVRQQYHEYVVKERSEEENPPGGSLLR